MLDKSLLSLRTSPTRCNRCSTNHGCGLPRPSYPGNQRRAGVLKMREASQLTYGSVTNAELASYSIDSYARGFTVTFPVLVNDNIGALADLSAKMNRGARGWFAGFLASTVIANPVLLTRRPFSTLTTRTLRRPAPRPPIRPSERETRHAPANRPGRQPHPDDPKVPGNPATIEEDVNKLLATLYPTSSAGAETAARGLVPVVVPQLRQGYPCGMDIVHIAR